MYFHNVATFIISPWKRAWPFICSNLKPFQPKMLFCKDWGSVSIEENENVKCLLTDSQTDGQQVIRKAHFSFQLR